jgi:hypothetical protein
LYLHKRDYLFLIYECSAEVQTLLFVYYGPAHSPRTFSGHRQFGQVSLVLSRKAYFHSGQDFWMSKNHKGLSSQRTHGELFSLGDLDCLSLGKNRKVFGPKG